MKRRSQPLTVLVAAFVIVLAAASVPDRAGNAQTNTHVSRGLELHVQLDRGGTVAYRLSGKAVSPRKLTSVLRGRLNRSSVKAVTIVAPSTVSFLQLEWAIECAKEAGAETISLDWKEAVPATPN